MITNVEFKNYDDKRSFIDWTPLKDMELPLATNNPTNPAAQSFKVESIFPLEFKFFGNDGKLEYHEKICIPSDFEYPLGKIIKFAAQTSNEIDEKIRESVNDISAKYQRAITLKINDNRILEKKLNRITESYNEHIRRTSKFLNIIESASLWKRIKYLFTSKIEGIEEENFAE